jgi:hypothetical protein
MAHRLTECLTGGSGGTQTTAEDGQAMGGGA